MNNKRKNLFIAIILFYTIVKFSLLLFLLLFVIILIFKNNNKIKLFKYFLLVMIYVGFFNLIFFPKRDNFEEEKKENLKMEVIIKSNLKIEENYLKFETIKKREKIEIVYYFKSPKNNQQIREIYENLGYGEVYTISIDQITKVDNRFNNKNSFDYENYMLSKRINKKIEINDYEKVGYKKNFIYSLKNYRKNLKIKLEQRYPKNYEIINSLVLGYTLEDEDLSQVIKELGIIQLFTISGMHINFLIQIVENILKRFKLSSSYTDMILLIFLPFYGIMSGMGVSIRRAIFMKVLSIYYKKKEEIKKISKFDIWFSVFLFEFFLNPYIIFNIGFIFSYFMTLFLIMNKDLFIIYKSSLLQNYLATTYMLPLIINLNSKVNLLIFLSLSYYEKLVKLMMIVSFLALLFLNFQMLSLFLNMILDVLICILNILNKINLFFVINVRGVGIVFIIIYYYYYYKQIQELYYFRLSKVVNLKKMFILVILIIFNFNVLGEVDIIDVGQGDSILIKYPFGGDNILIDTGDLLAEDEIINYLNYKGVRKIDYFIITHNHQDHNGNLEEILENFKVENLIINKKYYLEKEEYFNGLIFQDVNLITVEDVLEIPKGYIYAPNNYDTTNENNNSLIFYAKLGFQKWLFMGDCEIQEEKEFIDKYPLDVDFIKLAHHGSNTATQEEFLNITTPKEVFISSGKDNQYNHPSFQTLEKLDKNQIKYLDTQTNGEINKYFI